MEPAEPTVLGRAREALEETPTEVVQFAVSRVQPQHSGVVAAEARVVGRPTEHLRPVGGQALDMFGMLVRV